MIDDTTILTERVRMIPLREEHADALHRLWTAPGVRRFLWDDLEIPREQTVEIIRGSMAQFREEGHGLWGAWLRDDDRLAGFAGYWYFHEPPELQLLYGIAEEHWGKGLATECAMAMLRHGFEHLRMERVVGSADAPNEASLRVMEKAGMSRWKEIAINGRPTVYYELSAIPSPQ